MSIWTYSDPMWTSTNDPTGYDVEASDGRIGSIDAASTDVGASYIVVDTGWWIFGKTRLIPAGTITQVNHEMQKVYLSLTKDGVKNAPDFDDTIVNDDRYRQDVGDYYTG